MMKRLHAFYVKCYEHFRMWLERHDPKPMQHFKDPPEVEDWKPASAHHCPYCTWQWMMWDAFVEQWTCPHCGTSRYPALSVTEKRPVVRAVEPVVVRSLITLPEQIAIQPPHTPHIITAKRLTVRFEPGEIGRKFATGELELRDGKPCYKGGRRIDTDQLPYIPKSRIAG